LFGEEGKCIQVLNHFRDLGSHACLDNTKTAKTLNERVEKATERVRRLRWLKISTARKVSIIKSDILQAGLYGCETSRISVDVMAKFKTAIIDTIGTKSQHRAQEIIFEIHDKGKDMDPEIQALVRKVTLLRRITDKFPNKALFAILFLKIIFHDIFEFQTEILFDL
jgi:hypothetical protein